MVSHSVFVFVGGSGPLDLAKDPSEELEHLVARGELRAPARIHVLQASGQAALAGVRISAEVYDEDAGVGGESSHA